MRLLLVRHGETDWNAAGRIQGRTDTPLNDRGRAQAAELAARLKEEGGAERLYTSPAKRALETAEIIGAALGLEPQPVGELMELSFGAWEGCTWEEIQRRWPEDFAFCEADRLNRAPPFGESYAELMARACPVVERLRRAPGGTAIAVCHSAVIRSVVCALRGLDIGQGYALLRIKNSSVTELADLSAASGGEGDKGKWQNTSS